MSESTVVMIPEPMPPLGEVHLAAAGFLSRYSGKTRIAYALDLKTYFVWCSARGAEVFAMTRPHVEVYVRWMEEQRRYAPATIARRPNAAMSFRRSGANPPIPPIWIAIDEKFAKPSSAYVRMIAERGCSTCEPPRSVANCA